MNVHPNISPSQQMPVLRANMTQARFGAGPVDSTKLTSGLTKTVDHFYQSIMGSRSSQMIWEDLIGFGLMRAGIDLYRDKLSAKQQPGGKDQSGSQGQLNWAAAGERVGRETASILTDNILGGFVAALMGKYIFDKTYSKTAKTAALHNKFIDFTTLEAFQKAVGKDEKEFVAKLADSQFAKQHHDIGKTSLQEAWKAGQEFSSVDSKQLAEKIKTLTAELSEKLGEHKQGFTYIRKRNADGHPVKTVNLHALLEDVSLFSQHMEKLVKEQSPKSANAKTWHHLADETLQRTLRAKNITIPAGLGLAMLATFSVPFAISGISRKFFGITSYPGELAARKAQQKEQKEKNKAHQGFWEGHAPYLTECVKKGNYWPLLLTLSPLPLAAGIVNTTKLSKLGLPTFVKSWKEWKHLFDYQKLKPFTAQQQMAALFALLISARLLNSRTDNEFNERALDSFVGWGAWIMGTPILNKLAAKALDHYTGTALTKPGELGLRSRAEIEALTKLGEASEEVMRRTLKSHIWMQVGTTVATMIGLGIFIPWGCLKLTQRNENHKQQLQAAQPQPVKPVPQPIVQAPSHFFHLANRSASVPVPPSQANYRDPFYNASAWPVSSSWGYNRAAMPFPDREIY